MRQSQRQRERRYQSTIAPLQSKRLKVHSEAPCKQRNSISTSDQVLEDVLKQWFQCMLPHVWYKIIPSSADDVNNIAFAMGQRWDLVSSVLIHLKFLTKYKDEYRISHNKFEEFKNMTMYNLGSSRRKGKKYIIYVTIYRITQILLNKKMLTTCIVHYNILIVLT